VAISVASVLGVLITPAVTHVPVVANSASGVVERLVDKTVVAPIDPELRKQTAKIVGTRCSKVGLKREGTQATFVCKKKGKKLVWVKSAPAKAIAPETPSPSTAPLAPKSVLSPTSVLAPVDQCKLRATGADGPQDLIRTGFPRVADAALPVGDVIVQVVPVDYPNLTGQRPLADTLKPIAEGVTDYYKKISGGRLNLTWRLPTTAVRMPQPVEHYRLGSSERNNGYSFVQDVINASDSAIDFSGASFVLVLNPETASPGQIDISPAQQMTKLWKFRSDEGDLYRATYTSSMTRGSSGWIIIAHELGHSLGLPDTYQYEAQFPESQAFTGRFDLMSSSSFSSALELFAWNKWQLDFIGDTQVYCLTDSNVNRFLLSPISAGSGNPEMLVLPLSETTAIVIESRRNERFDAGAALRPVSDGLLVYQVDTTKATVRGPVKVIRKPGSVDSAFLDNLLGVGEQLQVGPFTVKNIENGPWETLSKLIGFLDRN